MEIKPPRSSAGICLLALGVLGSGGLLLYTGQRTKTKTQRSAPGACAGSLSHPRSQQ